MSAPEWQSRIDAERRQELARRSLDAAGGGRTWTGWKATLAIIAVVAVGALFLNYLISAESTPVPTPTVTTPTP